MLLGIAIASYLAARIWVINETVHSLSNSDSSNWEAEAASAGEQARLWQSISLWAIAISLLLYAGSFMWYLSKGRR